MKRWRSFPVQLFLLTVLPLTVFLLAIAVGSVTLHQQAMRSMVGERDERATRAAAAAISEQLNHRRIAIRSLALQATLSDSPDHALADATFLLPDFDGGLALYDTTGSLLAATTDQNTWQAPVLQERLLSVVNRDIPDDAFFLPPFTNPTSGEALLMVVAQEDGFIAVGAFSPVALVRQVLSDLFAGSEQILVLIVSQEGTVIYQTGSLNEGGNEWPQHPGVAEALRGESGTTYLSLEDEEQVVAFSPVAPVGWALVTVEPWRGEADPLLSATEQAPLILVPVLMMALIVLWFGVRQIVQPLQALEQQATRLGWGDFTAIEERVGGISEIQRLQTELIHMARKVQIAQQSLRGYLGAVTVGQEEERRRLARELHDDTIQSLIALNQQIQLAQLAAADAPLAAHLNRMQQMAGQIVDDLRRLTRDLRPIYLEDLGLVPALEMLARDTGKALGILVLFSRSGSEHRLSPTTELALYRMAQEGLNNVGRHAQATQAEVQLRFDDHAVILTVQDNGRGFIVPESPAEMAATGHFGLLGIQERAELIRAQVVLKSGPGTGTILTVVLPESSWS